MRLSLLTETNLNIAKSSMRIALFLSIFFVISMLATSWATADERRIVAGVCGADRSFSQDAYYQPMTFRRATSKGNMNTSNWIAATGKITPETPSQFIKFLREHGSSGQVVLHSPGGNLVAGMQLGRVFREQGLSTHVGETVRYDMEREFPCRTWVDHVKAGECSSACEWAFLGGVTRFVHSPYYPTKHNRLGFHQFFSTVDAAGQIVSQEQANEIRNSSLSVAQYLTGLTVDYSLDMGIDARAVTFATHTDSSDMLYPSDEELAEFKVTTPKGFGKWFLEPYKGGLVAAARPSLPTSTLVQTTAFCRRKGHPQFLLTMKGFSSFYLSQPTLPISGSTFTIDGRRFAVPSSQMSARLEDTVLYLTVNMSPELVTALLKAATVSFTLEAPRSFGNFHETSPLNELARKSIGLAWRNCF